MHIQRIGIVVAFFALNSVLHAEDADVKAVMERLDRLTQLVENQQKTIQDQQKKLELQEKQIAAVTSSGAIARSPAEIIRRIDMAEKTAAGAMQVATRKKASDSSPYIGAAVDTAFRYFDGNKSDSERPAGNDFGLRGAELMFYTDVDPYFKSYIVINATGDAENNDEAIPSIEEAAIYTTSLPHVQVKGGRFFVPFGRLSMIHDHDLPFVTRPRSIDTYVGGESGGDGLQIQSLLPLDHFLQITGGVFNKIGADNPLPSSAGNRRNSAEMTFFLKALTSFDIGDDHTIEAGVSAIESPDHLDRRSLQDLELTYKWHPKSQLREKLVWGAELLRNEVRTRFVGNPDEVELDDDPVFKRDNRTGYGGYSYVEYFLDPHWSFGPRIDLFQNTDPSQPEGRTYDQTYSLFLTYKFSEFSRLRFEGSRHEFFNGQSANEFYLQWTVFWGAHTHNFDQR